MAKGVFLRDRKMAIRRLAIPILRLLVSERREMTTALTIQFEMPC